MSARERLIASTIDLMRRNGVAGTGVSQLLQVSDTARRSLYLNFPGGKADLVAAATGVAGHTISSAIRHLTADGDPIGMLVAFIALWREALVTSDFTGGCPVMAAALGRGEAPAAADLAGEAFTEWEQLITASVVAHGIDAERAARLATTCIAAIEGAVLMAVAKRSGEPIDRVERVLVDLCRSEVG